MEPHPEESVYLGLVNFGLVSENLSGFFCEIGSVFSSEEGGWVGSLEEHRTGWLYVFHRCTCTTGRSLHLYAYAGPRRANREFLHFTIFWSMFFCSSVSLHHGKSHSCDFECGMGDFKLKSQKKLNTHISTCEVYEFDKCYFRVKTISAIGSHMKDYMRMKI